MSESLCFRIAAPEGERDRLLAEVWSRGCLGVLDEGGVLWVYVPGDADAAPLLALADRARGIRVAGPERVPDEDWERSWRAGLAPRQIAGLWIRPSWCAPQGAPELVIDPEQAFGSGEHATTRLALRLLLEALQPGDTVLDVGTGSGILALGALRAGAVWACGIDVDAAACANAAANGTRNGLRLALVRGSLDALDPGQRFEIVVANMLSARLAPWLERLGRHAGRVLVLSGYLDAERDSLLEPLRRQGIGAEAELSEEQSGDLWCASRFHTRSRQSSRSSASVSSNG